MNDAGGSPVGDSKSNGVAERAIQSMEKLIRVHKLSIETRINEKLSVRHPLFAWLVEFCADLYNRFQIGSRRQNCTSASQGATLEPGDGGVWHCGNVQSVRKSARFLNG